MKSFDTALAILTKYGFKEHWPPTPVYSGDKVVGSKWHYSNGKKRVSYNWYTGRWN